MRNYITLITIFVLFFGFTISAQQQRKSTLNSPQNTKSLSPEKVEELKKKIAQIEGHLQAIETKKSFVLADSLETVKANESGWFQDMEAIQSRLTIKKQRLLNLLKFVDND